MKYLLLLALFTACGSDPDPIEPTGTWNLSLVFGQGSCGLEDQATSQSWAISKIADGEYLVIVSAPSDIQDAGGVFLCDPDGCGASITLDFAGTLGDGTPYSETDSYDLYLDTDNAITGSGLAEVTVNPNSCTQEFAAEGRR